MPIATITWNRDHVRLIDQTCLPLQTKIISCRDVKSMWWAIRRLQVRGAPAIGVAGAFGVLLAVKAAKTNQRTVLLKQVDKAVAFLSTSRPTAVNLFHMLKRMQGLAKHYPNATAAELRKLYFKEAMAIADEDKITCRKMAEHGATLFKSSTTAMTICNAGALATVDYGTALGVFYRVKEMGKELKVISLETRPLWQGARLTCWELLQHQVDTTLICDNMAASVLAKGKVDLILAGADRIAANGDTANKIGTYMLAVLAKYHRVPFYIVAPFSTFDMSIKSGKEIPIEERDPSEVTDVKGQRIAAPGVKVLNPAFDVTPADLIAGIVTEKGIIFKPNTKRIAALFNLNKA